MGQKQNSQPVRPGDILERRFTLQDQLSDGRSADVWCATDSSSGNLVAIKRLKDSALQSQFKAEWQTLRALNHPHIVRAFDFFSGAEHFFAQYLVDGPTLADLRELGLADALRPIALLCQALDYLHARELVHGDLNPRNIAFDQGGAPYLLDFGCARRGDLLVGMGECAPAYRSPGREAGQPPGPQDDLYALGVLLSELILADPSSSAELPAIKILADKLCGTAENRPSALQVAEYFKSQNIQAGPLPTRYIQSSAAAAKIASQSRVDPVIAVSPAVAVGTVGAVSGNKPIADTDSGGVSPRLVWGALAVLVAVVIYVVGFLGAPEPVGEVSVQQAESQKTQQTETDVAKVESEEASEEEILFSEGQADESMRTDAVKSKNKTDRLLGELLTKQEILEKRAVELWGSTKHAQALEFYASGDRYYLAKDYSNAGEEYQNTIDLFDSLITGVDGEFVRRRDDADEALESGDWRSAERLYAEALKIAPADSASEAGLARAKKLDSVLSLVTLAENAEEDGDFGGALDAYEKALLVDALWEPALSGRDRVAAVLKEQAFQASMTEGFVALESGEFAQARAAFNAAKKINSGSRAPQDGLLQLDQQARLGRISVLTRQASAAEQAENWPRVAELYKAVLAQDANLAIAKDGLSNANARHALDLEMQRFIDAPDSLSDATTMSAAAGLLSKIARIPDPGPKLNERKAKLSQILKRAAQPIEVRLVSDQLTDVAVYKVGKLGRFDNTRLSLRPGLYTAVGSRPGFKDVRLTFRVAPEETMSPVVVRCEEPI
ncbi:MAG: protein kinase [Pseudomonadota bacterium]